MWCISLLICGSCCLWNVYTVCMFVFSNQSARRTNCSTVCSLTMGWARRDLIQSFAPSCAISMSDYVYLQCVTSVSGCWNFWLCFTGALKRRSPHWMPWQDFLMYARADLEVAELSKNMMTNADHRYWWPQDTASRSYHCAQGSKDVLLPLQPERQRSKPLQCRQAWLTDTDFHLCVRSDLEVEPHWMPCETACHGLTKACLCNDMEQRSNPSPQKAEHEKVLQNMFIQADIWMGCYFRSVRHGLRFRKGRSGGLYKRDARTASGPGIALLHGAPKLRVWLHVSVRSVLFAETV